MTAHPTTSDLIPSRIDALWEQFHAARASYVAALQLLDVDAEATAEIVAAFLRLDVAAKALSPYLLPLPGDGFAALVKRRRKLNP
jgi:hypothetical protein